METKKHSTISLLILLFIASCNSNVSKTDESDSNVPSEKVSDINVAAEKYNKSDTIIIIEKTQITDSTDQEYSQKCINWSLSVDEIKNILSLSDKISGHDFHYLYYYLPCEIQGNVILEGKKYEFNLNSGSFIYLASSDTSFYMGCSKPDCEKYFLEKGGVFGEEFE